MPIESNRRECQTRIKKKQTIKFHNENRTLLVKYLCMVFDQSVFHCIIYDILSAQRMYVFKDKIK